jgi:hypothetical protein
VRGSYLADGRCAVDARTGAAFRANRPVAGSGRRRGLNKIRFLGSTQQPAPGRAAGHGRDALHVRDVSRPAILRWRPRALPCYGQPSFGTIDKSSCRALFARTGKRSPREATCPRIASDVSKGRRMSANSALFPKKFVRRSMTPVRVNAGSLAGSPSRASAGGAPPFGSFGNRQRSKGGLP